MLTLEGSYSSADCKAECENFNTDCWTYGCDLGCGGVRITDVECVLTISTNVFSYTDDETAHYKKYVCEVPDGSTGSITILSEDDGEDGEDGEDTTSSIAVTFSDDGEDGEGSIQVILPEETTEESETENVVFDEDGVASCTIAQLFSECNYLGDSAIVNLYVYELTWEPQSWCIPEY